MASSNPLRPQNRTLQNQTGLLKNQEVTKTQLATVPSSKRGSENLDPNASDEAGKGVSKLKAVSRLPILAKSLQPALSDLSQQNRWEQKPLTGKVQKKKTCTKPVPFNLSQSRARSQRNADAASGKAPLTPSAQVTPGAKLRKLNPSTKLETTSHKATPSGVLRTHANKSQSALPQTVGHMECVASKSEAISHKSGSCSQIDLSSRLGSITLVQSNLHEDSGLSNKCKDSFIKVGVASNSQTSKDKHCFQTVQSATGTQSHAGTKALHYVFPCEGSGVVGAQSIMPRLSTCPPGPGTSNNLPQRVSVKKSQSDILSTTDNPGVFSPDPSALRSILQNDAMRVLELVGATPRVSTCPTGRGTSIYSAQRVPVRKPQTDDTAPAGSTVSFSPDPSALRSILQNEGVRAGAPGGATPRVSTCPTGRGTSIYSAQRVPVKKTKTEATGAASHCANRTPVMTWTPQRIANTKPQSMRKLLTAQKMSRFRDSPGLSGPQCTELLMHQEEDVVQRLFEEPDQMDNDQMDKNDVTSMDKNDVTSRQLMNSHQSIGPITTEENSYSNHCNTESVKEPAQPFIQAAHRGSVIVFSSSQRLCGSDRPQDTLLTPGASLQLDGDSAISYKTLQSDQSNRSQITSSSDVTKQNNTSTQSQPKAPTIAHCVAALRRRHTLEEMILDEECATYTSRLLSCPLRPRCGNPVATTLQFEDSTCFLPIGLSSPVRLSPVLSGSSIRA